MAKTTIVQINDDIDGSSNAQTYRFALQGTEYEIDLSPKNFKALEKALKPYVDAGTKSGKRTAKRTSTPRRDLSAVRAWARENGFEVSDRGRIPKEVTEAYDAAN